MVMEYTIEEMQAMQKWTAYWQQTIDAAKAK